MIRTFIPLALLALAAACAPMNCCQKHHGCHKQSCQCACECCHKGGDAHKGWECDHGKGTDHNAHRHAH